jgi:hypothetical protein
MVVVPAQVDVSKATNVLDRWINAASRSLTAFVRKEMEAYRLYTVVPYLVRFIESLTNVYVRYNRTRLKGRSGEEDCRYALASLFDVLLTVCKVRGSTPGGHYWGSLFGGFPVCGICRVYRYAEVQDMQGLQVCRSSTSRNVRKVQVRLPMG